MSDQTTSPILRVRSLDKRFGGVRVLENVNLDLATGVQVLVGPNGAGKSTLLSIIAGVEPASGGTVEIRGVNLRRAPAQAKRHSTYVPDRPSVYPFLTGDEFIGLVPQLRGIAGAGLELLVERFAIGGLRGTRFGEMSLGMQRKFMMAAAFAGNPALILLDEPTSGLDAAAREVLLELIAVHRREALVLCATHDEWFIQCTGAGVLLLRDHGLRPVPMPEALAIVRAGAATEGGHDV